VTPLIACFGARAEDGIRIGALKFNSSQTSNFSIMLLCAFILLVLTLWFHRYYHYYSHTMRSPFPDSTEDQLEHRSWIKFFRAVQISHPITMLIYAYGLCFVACLLQRLYDVRNQSLDIVW
jgi:hypothetical protein